MNSLWSLYDKKYGARTLSLSTNPSGHILTVGTLHVDTTYVVSDGPSPKSLTVVARVSFTGPHRGRRVTAQFTGYEETHTGEEKES